MTHSKLIRALLVGGSLWAFAGAAHSQTAPAKNDGLADIVVTANRTESTAQKTAIALTVYTGDSLKAAGVSSVQSLASIDPSINVTSSTGAAYVAVRGIASTDVTEIGDPSVPIARDGFFTNRSFSIQSSLYDVNRIEVLKGPQGTLNGRNSTGGLVSIITNKPTKTSGSFGSLEVGNFGTFNGELGTNLALSDTVQFRASGSFRRHDGYRNVTGINIRGDDEESASGRAQLAFQPFAGFKGWASYQHDDIDEVGDVALASTLTVRPDFGDGRTFPNSARTSTKLTGDRFRWEFSYDRLPAGLTLTYAGGYDNEQWNHKLDATGPGYPANRQFIQSESPKTWNHEVRISSSPQNPFFVQAGYFHFDEKNVINSGLLNLDMTGPFAPSGPFAALSQSGVYGIKFDYNVRTLSNAVFGQVVYKFSDQFKLTLGARNTWDSKLRTGQAFLIIPALASPFAPPIQFPTPGNGSIKLSQPTVHIGLDYTPNSHSLFYAKFDTGYKSGGFNSNGSAPSVNYDPEKLKAFEIGTKNRFMGNKLQINAAAFYFDYKGYQASQTSAALGGGDGIFNVGSAKIYGAEAQIVAIVTEGGRVDVNAAYLHTKFGDNISVRDGGGTIRPIGGNELPNAPGFSASAAYQQEFAVGDGKVTARIDGKYSSSFYYSVFNDADTQSRGAVTGNVSLGYAPAKGPWKIQAYVRNFTDKVVLANAARNFVANVNTYEFQPPRTFGVQGSFKF